MANQINDFIDENETNINVYLNIPFFHQAVLQLAVPALIRQSYAEIKCPSESIFPDKLNNDKQLSV